jgi:ABC-type multidrug transport system ATPase subunit
VPHRSAGSGKTSLLNALAGRLPKGGLLEGEVRAGISRQSIAVVGVERYFATSMHCHGLAALVGSSG